LNLRKLRHLENLYVHIKNTTGLSEEGWNLLKEVLTIRHFKKGDYLLHAGQICSSIFYIEEGYCRAFYDYDGQLINTSFYFEKEFATNIRSLKHNLGSEYAICAEEEMKVIVFDKDKLYVLFGQSVEVETMGRKLMEAVLELQEERAKLFKFDSAQLRYDYMKAIQPEITPRVPLEYIASYLGINLDTLHTIHAG
jgi:CRP-like cAMP-binding protein